jgi:hypothetical protein
MKRLVMAAAVAATLAFLPSQSNAEEGIRSANSLGTNVTTAVYRPSDDAQVTDVRWRRYGYYPRSYSYYPRYSYNYGYYPRSYGYYGYSPRYYNYGYRYPYSYNYRYSYGYRPGISFGFRF